GNVAPSFTALPESEGFCIFRLPTGLSITTYSRADRDDWKDQCLCSEIVLLGWRLPVLVCCRIGLTRILLIALRPIIQELATPRRFPVCLTRNPRRRWASQIGTRPLGRCSRSTRPSTFQKLRPSGRTATWCCGSKRRCKTPQEISTNWISSFTEARGLSMWII